MKFILIEKGDGNDGDRIIVCATMQERKDATIKAIFGEIKLSDDQIDEAANIMKELREEGHISFEGDPGVEWINANEIIDPTPSPLTEKLKLAKVAILHLLDAIAYDPPKYWLLGNGTGSWDKLTKAAAALWDQTQDQIKQTYQPDKDKYKRYCAEKEQNERLLVHCHEKGIKVESE